MADMDYEKLEEALLAQRRGWLQRARYVDPHGGRDYFRANAKALKQALRTLAGQRFVIKRLAEAGIELDAAVPPPDEAEDVKAGEGKSEESP